MDIASFLHHMCGIPSRVGLPGHLKPRFSG
jgi:hypothetical protein